MLLRHANNVTEHAYPRGDPSDTLFPRNLVPRTTNPLDFYSFVS